MGERRGGGKLGRSWEGVKIGEGKCVEGVGGGEVRRRGWCEKGVEGDVRRGREGGGRKGRRGGRRRGREGGGRKGWREEGWCEKGEEGGVRKVRREVGERGGLHYIASTLAGSVGVESGHLGSLCSGERASHWH